MISCYDLLNLNIFKNIDLVAGKNGIYKNISWSYICQTLDFSQWVNGGELMFLTGMGMDLNEEKIINLIDECVKKDISGLVILTKSEYISNISDKIIEKANEVGLPLFNMPWNLKLIDVTREIANYIMKLSSEQNKEKELLNEILFSKDLDKKRITNLINQNTFNLDSAVFVSKIKLLDRDKGSNFKNNNISDEYVLNIIKSLIDKHNLKSILGFYENDIICILELENKEDFLKQKKILISLYKEVSKHVKLSLSMGSICEDIFSARKSYDSATKVFELYNCNGWDLEVIDYEEIGFYKVLFEINNYDKLREYCYGVLGDIIENDNKFETLKTLRVYLKNNCNLINTSKEMFIHRNTLIYRLNKIKTMLDNNLEDLVFKNELMNAIMIYDYLKYIDNDKSLRRKRNDFNEKHDMV